MPDTASASRSRIVGAAILVLLLAAGPTTSQGTGTARHSPPDLDWRTPGANALDALPIGNGRMGASVWSEASGDVLVLLSRTDSFSEASRLMKVGRLRLHFDPPLFSATNFVQQSLETESGLVTFMGRGATGVGHLMVFIDQGRDVLRLRLSAADPVAVTVEAENWRREERRLSGEELRSSWSLHSAPSDLAVRESADRFLSLEGAIAWYHRNDWSATPLLLSLQGLESASDRVADPILHRSFGARVEGPGFIRVDEGQLRRSATKEAMELTVVTDSAICAEAAEFSSRLEAAAATANRVGLSLALDEQVRAWREFWDRSWIELDGEPAARVPKNDHPLRFGIDSRGGNTFRGGIRRLSIFGRPLRPIEMARLVGRGEDQPVPPMDGLQATFGPEELVAGPIDLLTADALDLEGGFTVESWIAPAKDCTGRIADKITAGGDDGFLFDLRPERGLRVIVGSQVLEEPHCLDGEGFRHVAASFDPTAGRLAIWVDGRLRRDLAVGTDRASLVGRAYALQRFLQAASGRGPYPIKFNGSIFTVDPGLSGGPSFDPDWRRWGDCYWWQNTRLPYHSMPAAGDLDLMDPLFDTYFRTIPLARARARLWHGVEGAWFPETMTISGTYSNGDYGWDRTGHATNEVLCPWWQWAWNQGLELVDLMLDRHDYRPDEAFFEGRIVPTARAVLEYFDTRFARDEHGKLVITPTQALETHWHGVVDDMPCVAGLTRVTNRLLDMPGARIPPEDRALFDRIRRALPAIPTRGRGDEKALAPARTFDPSRQNCESPELYAVFPFRLFGNGRPDIEWARRAFRARHDRFENGWPQDGQDAALLGEIEEARRILLAKAANGDPRHRFPAIWGPNFDWLPDQCHGGNLMTTLQLMCLQPVDGKLLVLPCWPPQWNVSFRLHAPGGTTVECVYRGGRVERLEVLPASRLKDVLVCVGR